jgi:hypothetical protein
MSCLSGCGRARGAALLEAKAKLEREAGREARPDIDEPEGAGVEIELDPERFVTRSHGRRAWFREARRGLDERREQEARPIARSRLERLAESARRLEEELAIEHLANAAYEAWRRRGVAADGSRRMAPGTTKPYRPPELPAGRSTRRTPTRGSSRRSASGRCRATTRRRRSTSTRSWSPPR